MFAHKPLLFPFYPFERNSQKAKILNLYVFSYALSFANVKMVSKIFLYNSISRLFQRPSLKM